ncbi:hypothetical protein RBJ15_09410 [Pantoea sp. BS_4]|uniref:hypothetical protein n=1 Tax=Pantoea TaxID=53335 RepID=UPI001562C639|nr:MULTISPECIES: hypothetical protein [Pantoea]NRH24717.1 hypothetical protein [Pantoea stewartii]WRH23015.1 hypothetical protein GC090_20345 [Pantoea sp. JZ29]
MLYREAAVRLSQTILLIARELRLSVDQMFEFRKDGKVSEEEAATHLHNVQVVLETLYTRLLDPLTADYPDLRPECCGSGICDEQ